MKMKNELCHGTTMAMGVNVMNNNTKYYYELITFKLFYIIYIILFILAM